MDRVKVGCCGFPGGIKRYLSQFRLVEVQQTFYKLPRIETVINWCQAAPPEFEFTMKAWQIITHPPSSPTYRKSGLVIPQEKGGSYGYFRPSDEVMEAWHRTKEIARAVNATIIVFQCPASFSESIENVSNMRNFFQSLSRDGLLFIWEPRGQWSDSTIVGLCQELGLIHCVDPLQRGPLYGAINYFRLHGGPGYRHSYSNEELEHLRQIIGDRESYVLFNNMTMYNDALRFISLLGREVG